MINQTRTHQLHHITDSRSVRSLCCHYELYQLTLQSGNGMRCRCVWFDTIYKISVKIYFNFRLTVGSSLISLCHIPEDALMVSTISVWETQLHLGLKQASVPTALIGVSLATVAAAGLIMDYGMSWVFSLAGTKSGSSRDRHWVNIASYLQDRTEACLKCFFFSYSIN